MEKQFQEFPTKVIKPKKVKTPKAKYVIISVEFGNNKGYALADNTFLGSIFGYKFYDKDSNSKSWHINSILNNCLFDTVEEIENFINVIEKQKKKVLYKETLIKKV